MDRRALYVELMKRQEVPPLSPTDTGVELSIKLLVPRAHDVYGLPVKPLKGDGAEVAHEVRVGSRRLNEALELLEPLLPDKRLAKAQKRIRRLRQAFGEKRAADVLYADLLSLVQEAGLSEPPGLAVFRRRGHRALANALLKYPPERLIRHGLDLLDLAHNPRRTELSLADVAGRHLYHRAIEVDPLLEHMSNPSALEEHHTLRIRLKRLRYTTEILREAFGDAVATPDVLDTLKSLQSALGLLNDAKDLVLWLHDQEVLSVLHPDQAADLIARARLRLATRYESARALVEPSCGIITARLRRSAGLIGQLEPA